MLSEVAQNSDDIDSLQDTVSEHTSSILELENTVGQYDQRITDAASVAGQAQTGVQTINNKLTALNIQSAAVNADGDLVVVLMA